MFGFLKFLKVFTVIAKYALPIIKAINTAIDQLVEELHVMDAQS